MSQIPKKKFIDAAQADGTMAEVSRLLSASYLMANLMWSFFDDATDMLKSHGLLLGDMSRATGRLNYSFKEYIAVFRDVFRNQSAQLDFDFSQGWVTDCSGLTDSLFEKYPTLSHRNDIRICINDAKVVKNIKT